MHIYINAHFMILRTFFTFMIYIHAGIPFILKGLPPPIMLERGAQTTQPSHLYPRRFPSLSLEGT